MKADRFDQSTLCVSWDVWRLINHVVGGSHWFAASTGRGLRLPEGGRLFIADAFRGPDGVAPFGIAVDLRDDAPAADQLAGFLGRKV